jgi:hypothetical protein
MDIRDIERLRVRADEELQNEQPLGRFIEGLEQYVNSREIYHFWFSDRNEFSLFSNLLDIEIVDGEDVLETPYRNGDDSFDARNRPVSYTGKWPLSALLNNVADRHAFFVEFVNDFEAMATIALDGETVVTVYYECVEQPGICESCSNDEEYMEYNSEYNCGHDEVDLHYQTYKAAIYDKSQMDEIRPEDGHLF